MTGKIQSRLFRQESHVKFVYFAVRLPLTFMISCVKVSMRKSDKL